MILRVCVVIPTYNNPGSISQVVADALSGMPHPVYIFDDGSSRPVEEMIGDLARHSRVKIFRAAKNTGKGATLTRAIAVLAAEGFTHMLTMDGDGQHLAREATKLVAAAKKYPWDLIIGQRNFAGATDVPGISQFGRKFSNFWVRYQTDLKIADSQSGLRLYPVFQVQMMHFWTHRFDFEIEVLIRLLWQNVGVCEIAVEVYYPPKNERVSHFDKLWDNVRISCLNTLLVIASLLRAPHSPKRAAFSVALGVFVGCTPLFGFHTLIVAALAFFLRLNALWMWLGSHVSLPIFAPFLILAETYVGKHLWPSAPTFQAYLLGALVVGATLGFLFGVATFVIAHRTQLKKNTKRKWTGRTRGGRFGNAFMKVTMSWFGLRAAYACLPFIIPYFYLFAPAARRSVNEYWRVVRPEASWFNRQFLCMNVFWVFAQTLLDRAYFGMTRQNTWKKKSPFSAHPNSWQLIADLQKSRRGGVLLSHHGGGWDLAASLIYHDKMQAPFFVVKYTPDGFSFDNVKGDAGDQRPLSSNNETQPILKLRELLQSGELVGMMSDRPIGSRYELVPFLGKLAIFDTTPFILAALCDVPLLATYGFKGEDNAYDFYAELMPSPALETASARALRPYVWLSQYIQSLERMVRQYDTQWFNFFSFWSNISATVSTSSGVAVSVQTSAIAPSQAEPNTLIEELCTPPRSAPASAPAP